MNPYQVLIRPLISEKSNEMREADGKYCFLVNRKASKIDVKKAVEVLFDVKVKNVNTAILRGKMKRRGMNIALTAKTKRAVVSLAEGQKLPLFEDQ